VLYPKIKSIDETVKHSQRVYLIGSVWWCT